MGMCGTASLTARSDQKLCCQLPNGNVSIWDAAESKNAGCTPLTSNVATPAEVAPAPSRDEAGCDEQGVQDSQASPHPVDAGCAIWVGSGYPSQFQRVPVFVQAFDCSSQQHPTEQRRKKVSKDNMWSLS